VAPYSLAGEVNLDMTPTPSEQIVTAVGDAISDGVDTVTSLVTSNVALLFAVPALLLAYKLGRRLFAKIG